MPRVCQNCLTVSDINLLSSTRCACGNDISGQVAIWLYRSVFEIGKRHVKMALTKRLKRAMEKAGGLAKVSLYNVPLKISEEKFFNAIRFDVTKFTDDKVIERIGAKFIRLVVEDKREELEKILGQKVEPAAAALVVAYLYDGETDRYASTIVQKASDLELEDFYLGENVAAQNNSGLVYAPPFATSIIVAFGNAELGKEAYRGYVLTTISKAVYPLGIIVRTSEADCLRKEQEIENARLFIFI